MGNEYRISGAKLQPAELKELLARLGRKEIKGQQLCFEFRSPDSKPIQGMPDASVTLASEDLWFCDCGGPREYVGHLFLRVVQATLNSSDWPDGIRIAQP